MSRVKVICTNCKKAFFLFPCRVKRNNYCSRKCMGLSKKGTPFYVKDFTFNERALSYLLGALTGDGYVGIISPKNFAGNQYLIRLVVKSIDFAKEVYSSLKQVGLNPKLWKRRDGLYSVDAHSYFFVRWFNNLSYKDIMELVMKNPKDFIRGFYEAEGSYGLTSRQVHFFNSNYELLKIVSNLLTLLDFDNNLINCNRRRNNCYEVYIRGGVKETIRFFKEIKPLIKNPLQEKSIKPVKFYRKKWTTKEKQLLIKLRNKGWSYKRISKYLTRSVYSLWSMSQKLRRDVGGRMGEGYACS